MSQTLSSIGTEKFLSEACSFLKKYENIAERIQGHDILLPPEFLPEEWITWASTLTDEQYNTIASDMSPNREEDYVTRIKKIVKTLPSTLEIFLTEAWSVTPRRTTDSSKFETTEQLFSVPAKKSRQITLMTKIVKKLSEQLDCHQVVDMGCGVGYLAREMYKTGLSVLGIERSKQFTETAKKLTNKHFLEENTVIPSQTINFMEHNFVAEDSLKTSNFLEDLGEYNKYILTGLHTCGDFGPSICKLFRNKENAAGIIHIPCCFHCLTENGFPSSETLKRIIPFTTTQEFRNLGLQDPATTMEPSVILGKRARRYVFEVIMKVVNRLHDPSIYARRIRRDERREEFPNYVRRQFEYFRDNRGIKGIDTRHVLLEALKEPVLSTSVPDVTPNDLSDDELCMRMYDRVICDRTKAIIRLSVILCFSMASCVEGLIIGDRILFLKESGCEVNVIEAWPLSVSPRNIMVIASKKDSI